MYNLSHFIYLNIYDNIIQPVDILKNNLWSLIPYLTISLSQETTNQTQSALFTEKMLHGIFFVHIKLL